MQSFLIPPGSSTTTPEGADRRRQIAEAMLAQGIDTSPVGHWTQGAARMAQVLAGGMINRRAEKAASEGQKARSEAIAALLGGGGSNQPVPAVAPSAGGMGKFGEAIAGIESSGKYDALGPVTDTGDRAYGKYQVMGANIPEWTRMHLGQEMSPEEFLANPQAQDAVFQGQFGNYVDKYGPEGAAKAWFAGETGMHNPNAQDQLGTSVSEYANKFTNAIGGGQQPMPQQMQQQGGNPMTAQIAELLGNPWTADMGEQLAMSAIENRMQANDPMRQMELERARLELEQLRNPQAKPTDDIREYEFARSQGYEGTFTDFMRDNRKAGATTVNNILGGEDLTPGQKKIDENFADTYISWTTGGFADADKMLSQLGDALGILESGENVTGAIGLVPDIAKPFVNEQGVIAKDAIEEVVQRNLREILGAQFTEKEGERLIQRAFNDKLKPQENAKRVRRLITQISSMAAAKQNMVDYFEENGTLRGYEGPRPTLGDIRDMDFGSPDAPEQGSGDDLSLDDLLDRYN